MVSDLLQGLRAIAAVVYSTTLGFLVFGLFWQTFSGWLPSGAVIVVGAVLAIRVTTLFSSMTAAATLNWRAIWIGGGVGLATLAGWWLSGVDFDLDRPPRILMVPLLLASLAVVATAGALPSPKTAHFYHSARFARLLHSLQGLLLFGAVLPASLFWEWTRPYAVGVMLSAFLLWKLWGGACPVTLTENEARAREGLPIIPPDSGFIPDVLAHFGIAVSGNTVALVLYGLCFSLCGWFGLTWLF